MCPCLGLHICGYHVDRIREDLTAVRDTYGHDDWLYSVALDEVGRIHGHDKVNLILNLNEPKAITR